MILLSRPPKELVATGHCTISGFAHNLKLLPCTCVRALLLHGVQGSGDNTTHYS